MLTTRLQILAVLTVFLSGPASPAPPTQGALTVARTSRLRVRPGTELALRCGDGTHTGTVQYWHTPFGQLRNHGDRGDHLAPRSVSVQSDGGLFAANAGVRHGGLYYCLLQAEGGTTLWPYRVTVGAHRRGPDLWAVRHRAADAGAGRHRRPPRHRRDRGSEEGANEEPAGVTDSAFAGAVVASVAVTFVAGFGAGALSSARVLRCLGLVSSGVQSLRRGPATGRGGGGGGVAMTTAGRDYDDTDSHWGETTMDTTCSSCTSPPPPPKPQRSFRDKRGEHPGPAAGLEEEEEVQKRRDGQEERAVEGRMKEGKEGQPEEDYVDERVEDRRTEERSESRDEEQIREVKQVDKGGEMEERRGSRPGESREGETDEKEVEQWIEERTERREEQEQEVDESILVRRESRQGEAGVTGEESQVSGDRSPMATITEGSSQAGRGSTGEPGRTSAGMREEEEEVVVEQTETTCAREQVDKGGAEEQGEVSSEDDSDSSSDTQDEGEQEKREEEREQVTKDDKGGAKGEEEGGTPQSGVARGRRSRVIRLYQYDDEGKRYSHLPSPAPGELSPTPRLKQRSLSLTRLSAIMAAATAGPLTSPGGGAEERCPSPPFSPAPVFKMDL